jgi:hypothetical protein
MRRSWLRVQYLGVVGLFLLSPLAVERMDLARDELQFVQVVSLRTRHRGRVELKYLDL